MDLIDSITIREGGAERVVQLLVGDLSRLDPDDAVDVLIVSALTAAGKWVGIIAHHCADVCCPLHIDQTNAEDSMQSDYAPEVDDCAGAVGENRARVKYGGYTATSSVAGYTKSTAAAAHRQYNALVRGFSDAGMSVAVLATTAKGMNRAANGLADLIVSLHTGVKGAS